MPIDAETLREFRRTLVQRAGGYLRNPIIEPGVTCAVCATPCVGYQLCLTCRNQRDVAGQKADQVASLTYAIGGGQSGYMMRSYKAPTPAEEHRQIVALTALVGLALHGECAGRRLGDPVTHWSVVPSLPAKAGPHPLRQLVVSAAPGQEVQLHAAAAALQPRTIQADHYTSDLLPERAHVLLLDDTWTGGGHAQSAALALRAAGAAFVSVLNVSRWIDPTWKIDKYGDNAGFLAKRCIADYDPSLCPWTGGSCPPQPGCSTPRPTGCRSPST